MRFFSFAFLGLLCLCSCAESLSLLSEKQTTLLAGLSGDHTFIQAFPFDTYRICVVPKQGSFYLDTTDDSIKKVLASGEPWEYETDQVIYQYTKSGTVALDIGAHIGTHTVALSRAVGADGVVIAFEPNPKIYRELCMNLILNGCTNVIPVQCALGDHDGQVGLLTPVAYNEGGTYVVTDGGGLVALRKLDDFGLQNISFIKMDVENYEEMVLAGGEETIMASRPVIFLEIQGNGEQLIASGANCEQKTEATISALKNMNYTTSVFKGLDYLAKPMECGS